MHLLHIPLLLVGLNADLMRANSLFHHMPSAVKFDRGPLKTICRLQNDSAVSDRIHLVTDRPKDLAIFQLNRNPCLWLMAVHRQSCWVLLISEYQPQLGLGVPTQVLTCTTNLSISSFERCSLQERPSGLLRYNRDIGPKLFQIYVVTKGVVYSWKFINM